MFTVVPVDQFLYTKGLFTVLVLSTLLHLLTLTALTVDSRLSSGVGHLLKVYVCFLVFRNVTVAVYIIHTSWWLPVLIMYCELTSVACQLKIVHSIWKAVSSKAVLNCDTLRKNFIFNMFTVNCISVMYYAYCKGLIYVIGEVMKKVHPKRCRRGCKGMMDALLLSFWPLPLTAANTLLCAVTAWRVRAARGAVVGPESRRHGPAHARSRWHRLLLRVILISGVQTDLVYCVVFTINYLALYEHWVVYSVACCVWAMRGVEVFFVFVCKREVWDRIRKKIKWSGRDTTSSDIVPHIRILDTSSL